MRSWVSGYANGISSNQEIERTASEHLLVDQHVFDIAPALDSYSSTVILRCTSKGKASIQTRAVHGMKYRK